VPSNEGRGYVLRRILRRAVRFGQQMLGAPPGFFTSLVPVVVDAFKDAFPELEKRQDFVMEVVAEEEESFERMLSGGIKYFNDISEELVKNGGKTVSGESAFYLYDTMGFPVDLTQVMAEEKGLTVDVSGFEKEMESQKQRSRDAALMKKSGGGAPLVLTVDETAYLQKAKVKTTDDAQKYEWDVSPSANVLAVFSHSGWLADGDSADGEYESVGVVLDSTTFYAEAGGQVGDTGTLVTSSGAEIEVADTQSYAGYILHVGRVAKGSIKVGESVALKVDYERRRKIAPNHSMTHILNYALRQVLEGDVDQKGSLCDEGKLRFDFTAKGALSTEQLSEVEKICREQVASARKADAQVIPLEKAMSINGLRAVFGEKYPDPVRVITFGNNIDDMVKDPESDKWLDGSLELCGGTHVSNTAEAKAFTLIQEEAVAKGVRRITAFTGELAEATLKTADALEAKFAKAEKLPALELGAAVTELRKEVDTADVSCVLKAGMRTRLDAMSKKYMDEKKANASVVVNQAIEAAKVWILLD
jgi:alanyl-tRNA synthetase